MATSLKADAHHHEPAILPFDWADPYDLEHQLTEEERLVRDTAENYAQEKLQPRVTKAYLETKPARIVTIRGLGYKYAAGR